MDGKDERMIEDDHEFDDHVNGMEMVVEVNLKEESEEAEEESSAQSTPTPLTPLEQDLEQIDLQYPPPLKRTLPISFHSAGNKRQRLHEPITVVSAARLYRDALHSIFQFLPLKEFVPACTINKVWYSAGQTMKSRKEGLVCGEIDQLRFLVASRLRVHITNLRLTVDLLDPDIVSLLDKMKHLEVLRLTIPFFREDLASTPPCLINFPPRLKEFWFRSYCLNGPVSHDINLRNYVLACLKRVAAHCKHLRRLGGTLPGIIDEIECPAEVQTISTLQELILPKQFTLHSQVDLVKCMSSLRRWCPGSLTPDAVGRLADGIGEGVCPPLLEDFGGIRRSQEDWDEPMTTQLKRLPSLTTLVLQWMTSIDPTTFLPHFPRLSTLDLITRVNPDQLCAALSSCHTLTELSLRHSELTSEHLSRFLPHLTSLLRLSLLDGHGLVSLKFLTDSTKSLSQLRVFQIHSATGMPLKEYHHLRAISSSLETLIIDNSTTEDFDSLRMASWTPGTPEFNHHKWPKLKEFVYRRQGAFIYNGHG